MAPRVEKQGAGTVKGIKKKKQAANESTEFEDKSWWRRRDCKGCELAGSKAGAQIESTCDKGTGTVVGGTGRRRTSTVKR